MLHSRAYGNSTINKNLSVIRAIWRFWDIGARGGQ